VSRSVGRALPYAAVALAASSWGAWGLAIRHAEAIHPMPASLESAIVMGVTIVVSAAVSLRDRVEPAGRLRGVRSLASLEPAGRTWKAWAGVAWFGVADLLNMLLFFAAYKLTIGVAVLTHYMAPVFVALTAPLVLREPMTVRSAVAVAVSVAGLAVMVVPSTGGTVAAPIWASAALGTGSAVFYASNVLVNKFIAGSFSASQAMLWHGVVATLLGALLVPPAAWATIDPRAVAFLSVVAVGPAALGGLAFVWGLRRIPAAHASTLTLLEPLVSVVLGQAVLGEPLGRRAAAGGALILMGSVAIVTQARLSAVESG
jgi:drug/metabolite transporter (DMT)-like permease